MKENYLEKNLSGSRLGQLLVTPKIGNKKTALSSTSVLGVNGGRVMEGVKLSKTSKG